MNDATPGALARRRVRDAHEPSSSASRADGPRAATPVSASLSGTIGDSLCGSGNTSAPCPFHLGSLALDLDEPLVLPVTCGGTTTTHTLSELSVRLEQPAFGIAEQGTSWKAFPAGAIVIDAAGVVDGVPFHVRRPNQEPLKLRAGEAWVLMQGARRSTRSR